MTPQCRLLKRQSLFGDIVVPRSEMADIADAIDPLHREDFGFDRAKVDSKKPLSSRLKFGRLKSTGQQLEAIQVGAPADEISRVAHVTPPARLTVPRPVTPPVATASDMAAGVEARVASSVMDGGVSTADSVVSSGASRSSTAVSGLRPKSAGSTLGLGLALAAGGAGLFALHRNRGRVNESTYRGA